MPAAELSGFEREIRIGYKEIMPDMPVLFKMKELWSFMCRSLPDSTRVWKKIKKTKKLSEYESIIAGGLGNGDC